METPLYTFEATQSWINAWLICSFITAIMGFSVYYFQDKLPVEQRLKSVIGLVAALVGFVFIFAFTLKIYSLTRLKPVKIYRNSLETPYGTAEFKNIKDFYIKIEKHYKPMQPNVLADSARYFFILERDDKGHVLSEGDYPVDSILAKLNQVMGY